MSKTTHTGEASEPRTTIQDGCASRGRRPCPAPARVREAGRGRADRGGEAALTVSGRRGVPTLTVLGGRGASGRRAGPCRCPAGRAGLWRPRRVPPWPCCHALRTISSARGRPASLCHLLVSGTCPCTQHKLPIDRTCVEIKARLCVVLILKTSPVQGKKKKPGSFHPQSLDRWWTLKADRPESEKGNQIVISRLAGERWETLWCRTGLPGSNCLRRALQKSETFSARS